MFILGISALYHDSAAAIVENGKIIAAAQEERFSRKKHDNRLPYNAIDFCLSQAGDIGMEDVDYVIYYDNPFLTLDRFVHSVAALGKDGEELAEKYLPQMFGERLWIHNQLRKRYGVIGTEDKLYVTEHHISHAASAFYPSPFAEAAIVTIDGVGEWATLTIGIGENNDIKILKEMDYPHSLGLLYSTFTSFCGFKVNSGDYKFMGLAPYGEPVYYDLLKKEIIDVKEDGSFRLNLEYFDFYRGQYMFNEKMEKLFGGPARKAESNITRREMDIAASVQKLTEEIIIKICAYARRLTGKSNLVMAGGVALNCVANGKLLKEKIFDKIWIQPAAGDAGGALGAALYMTYSKGIERVAEANDSQKGSYLGNAYTNEDVKMFIEKKGAVAHRCDAAIDTFEKTAKFLAENKIVGWFRGRMEYGPRALGNRSIIASPLSQEMQSKINLKIKYRESFRPFAPSVLEDKENEYFDLTQDSPYMLLVGHVNPDRRIPFDKEMLLKESNGNMIPVVNMARSDIPAITHLDYSARVQSVNEERNPDYYRLIREFFKLTGCGVIVNTSFNVRGEPIVCSLEDAYRCFMRTEMDVLVLEDYIFLKEEQPKFNNDINWRKEYELD